MAPSNNSTAASDDYDDTSIYSLENKISVLVDKMDADTGFDFYPGTERIDYDFAAERKGYYLTNLIESTAHLIKSCIGCGILVIHEAFMQGGLWTSLGITMFAGVVSGYTMLMLVSAAQKMYVRLRIPKLSYPDLAEVALATGPIKCCRRLSRAFRYLVEVFIFIEMCGVCWLYQLIVAHTLKEVLQSISSDVKDQELSMTMYILIITVPLLVLCMIRNLKYLAPFSILADVFIGLCVATTMYYSIEASGDIGDRSAWRNFDGLFRFTGVCVFSLDGMTFALPIENIMAQPKYFHMVVQWGMAFVILAVGLVGFFGYWGWGEACRSPITTHLPLVIVPIIMQFGLAIMLSITFAVHFWVPFRIVWHYIARNRFKRKRGHWERLARIILIALISALSIIFPNLNKTMSYIGNFFVAFITFIFPALIDGLVSWPEYGGQWWKLLKNAFLIALGVILFCGAQHSLVLDTFDTIKTIYVHKM